MVEAGQGTKSTQDSKYTKAYLQAKLGGVIRIGHRVWRALGAMERGHGEEVSFGAPNV